MVPFDNSQYYRDFDAEVSRKFHEVIPADAGLEETFKGMGILMSEWEIEEEMQRRKDGSVLYNSSNNVYKYFIRRKAQERYRNSNPLAQKIGQTFIDNSSLKSVATLADDGTLNVSLSLPCNVGSNKGDQYTVTNSMEAQYDSKRERFSNFLSSIPGSIHLDEIKKKKLENYSG